jgi:hypothetical protein
MAESKASKTPKVFDISKPGKSAPSASSKPIIITNRPVLKDPMMVDKPNADDGASKPLVSTASHVKIVPLHLGSDGTDEKKEDEKPSAPPAPTVTELAVRATARKVAAEVKQKEAEAEKPAEPEKPDEPVKPTDKKPAEPEPESAKDSEPAETDKATEDTKDPDEEEKAEEEAGDEPGSDNPTQRDKPKDGTKADDADVKAQKEQERKAELEKIAESHKYYLPINQIEKRRNKRATLLGAVVILVLGLAWADIALDAGLLTVPGVKAPTHFFSK